LSNLPISFEVYPPRSSDAVPALYEAIDSLALLDPAFISVTFGAGGSETKNSLEVLNYIQSKEVAPLAHLTCVGTTRDSARALVSEFVEAGILDFLALRGDFPEGTSALPEGSLRTAAELVEVIADVRGDDGITAVAAFPNGHPESGVNRSDIKALLAKQEAGADFAITQLFFEANDYLSFVELARSSGVEIPILPGIMPIISPKRLARVLELTGERNPSELEARLLGAQDPDARVEAGIDFAAKLVSDLVKMGAPGIHLYAFNEHERVTEVLRRADLVS
jgi:methylenetetrahydrofolate reductase (NADPH)